MACRFIRVGAFGSGERRSVVAIDDVRTGLVAVGEGGPYSGCGGWHARIVAHSGPVWHRT